MIRLVLVLMLTGCTITITPIAQKPKAKHPHSKTVAKTKPHNNSWLIVDSGWLVQYRMLEEEHGNYTLQDDQKVEAVGGGKYKVTSAMLDHFRDLSQSPIISPTPQK